MMAAAKYFVKYNKCAHCAKGPCNYCNTGMGQIEMSKKYKNPSIRVWIHRKGAVTKGVISRTPYDNIGAEEGHSVRPCDSRYLCTDNCGYGHFEAAGFSTVNDVIDEIIKTYRPHRDKTYDRAPRNTSSFYMPPITPEMKIINTDPESPKLSPHTIQATDRPQYITIAKKNTDLDKSPEIHSPATNTALNTATTPITPSTATDPPTPAATSPNTATSIPSKSKEWYMKADEDMDDWTPKDSVVPTPAATTPAATTPTATTPTATTSTTVIPANIPSGQSKIVAPTIIPVINNIKYDARARAFMPRETYNKCETVTEDPLTIKQANIIKEQTSTIQGLTMCINQMIWLIKDLQHNQIHTISNDIIESAQQYIENTKKEEIPDKPLDTLDKKSDEPEQKIETVEKKSGATGQIIEATEKKIEATEKKIDVVEKKS